MPKRWSRVHVHRHERMFEFWMRLYLTLYFDCDDVAFEPKKSSHSKRRHEKSFLNGWDTYALNESRNELADTEIV